MVDKKKVKMVVFAISSLLMISVTASAILANIALHYPEKSMNTVSMVLTLPALVGIIFSVASGPASLRISKKWIILFGTMCGLLGGAIAFTLGKSTFIALLIGAGLAGVAQGINATMTIAVISDYFSGEESKQLMGLQSAFVNGGSMVLALISGILAGIDWINAYLIYFLFIPVLWIVVRNLPAANPASSHEGQVVADGPMSSKVWFYTVSLFAFGVFLFVFQTNVSDIVMGNGWGTASTSGLLNSVMMGFGMITGILYGQISRFFKERLLAVAMLAGGIGSFMALIANNVFLMFIAAGLLGFCLSATMPTILFLASEAAGPAKKDVGIAFVNGALNLGMFLSPIIVNAISQNFGRLQDKFMISVVGFVALAVILSFSTKREARA
jgi:MFS family permease